MLHSPYLSATNELSHVYLLGND